MVPGSRLMVPGDGGARPRSALGYGGDCEHLLLPIASPALELGSVGALPISSAHELFGPALLPSGNKGLYMSSQDNRSASFGQGL